MTRGAHPMQWVSHSQSAPLRVALAPQTKVTDQLSPREREIIYLIARGLSRKECARLCQISPHTVAEYTKNAYRKLGVRNRFEAADALRSI